MKFNALMLPVVLILASGCSDKEADTTVMTPPPAPTSVELTTTQTAPPPVAAPGATAPVEAKASSAINFTAAERPVNDQGDAMSDLEYLNHLVFQLNESRISGTTIVQKTFKTEAEQMAYEEAQQKKTLPVRSLQELVDAGVLKSVPQGPNGQHYAIDPNTGKVVVQ